LSLLGNDVKGLSNIIWCVVLWTAALVLTLGFAIFPLGLWAFLVFQGGKGRAEACRERLKQLLIKNETVIADAMQTRAQALFKRREYVATTNSRILYLRRGVFGGFRMLDYQWKDLLDVSMLENGMPSLNGSRLTFRMVTGRAIFVDGLTTDAALKLYSQCQGQEQVWEEKRRIRAIDEHRGTFGSGMFGLGGQQEVDQIADKLKKAKDLLDTGAINDVEFEELKAKIIARG